MSVYEELASILRKAQGSITEDGGTIDVGREVVMLRSAHDEQKARIAELESLIKDIHDKLYGEVYGWDDGSDEWQAMRVIARKALLGGGE